MKRIIIIISMIISTCCYGQTNSKAVPCSSLTNTGNDEVILISFSMACRCTLEKCKSMRGTVKTILLAEKYKKIKFTEIDYAADQKTANAILAKYKLGFPPSVVVLGKNEKVYYSDFNKLNEEQFTGALNSILTATNTGNKEKQK